VIGERKGSNMKINKNETRKSSREVNKGRKNEIEKNERK
jgi:hypothetical protein